ncbi:ABC-three component system protein [Candidatus Electronema sp. JC]|uniref:ABC-three component system protein n=1 Tax=Candidatus Electronema sp. JC TaxID=3401570 RepID=UPI003B432D31
MIHRIFSSLSTFKELEFHSGLNILIAQKEAGATDKQTRNRAGKTSLIEIIHFLCGATADKDSIFRSETLCNESFGMTFDLGGETITATRSSKTMSKLHVEEGASFLNGKTQCSNTEWTTLLGEKMFGLHNLSGNEGRSPTFRLLFPYFVRRQNSGAFATPEQQATKQQTGDVQTTLLYLLDLDWQIASEWQKVRDREKTLKELKKAAGSGAFGSLIGKASELRTQVTVAEAKLKDMQAQLAKFHVLPQYAELEAEADQLTYQISKLANANVADDAAIRDLEAAMCSEAPPPLDALESIYAEAGISLPGLAIRRYDEVRAFHESVIRNRRDYLGGELEAARQRVAKREQEKQTLDQRRAVVMNLLKSHGALEQFSMLQTETARKTAEVEALRQRFAAAEQLEGTKNELDIERISLVLRLRRDFDEQKDRLDEAILAFEATSKRLYESAGSINLEESSNGPKFHFPMQGARSKGIKNMQIFCFDMMLMRLCAKRGIGPGFLVHDSHLFDGVDGRQVVSALKAGAETAEELGFQYIVTMNEDDAFKETTDGFNVRQHILPVVLTDAKEDGGLFGCRF